MIPKLILNFHTSNTLAIKEQLEFFNYSAKKLLKNGYIFELCATESTKAILKEYYSNDTCEDKVLRKTKEVCSHIHAREVAHRRELLLKNYERQETVNGHSK